MSNDPEILEIPVLPRLEKLSSYGLKALVATVLATFIGSAIAAELANRRRNLFRTAAALLTALFLVAGGVALERAGEPGHSPVSQLR